MKKYMYYIIVFITITFFVIQRSFAQVAEYKSEFPRILPMSPNAASLGEYGKVPIEYFNGKVNVNIPLYEIAFANTKLPISISYSSSGIQVAQEASWVGLGWALNAGGCITRQCIGGDDFNDLNILSYIYNGDYINSLKDPEVLKFNSATQDQLKNYDTDPDIFNFNFGNYSGSFFFANDQVVINTTYGYEACVKNSKSYLKAYYNKNNNSWLVIDGDGIKYFFGGSESSRDYTSANYSLDFVTYSEDARIPDPPTLNGIVPYGTATSAWLIDSIIAPNDEKIEFLYVSERITTVTHTDEDIRIKHADVYGSSAYCSDAKDRFNYFSHSNAEIKQMLLSEIKFNTGYIKFHTTDRYDLDPANLDDKEAQKLSSIEIFNLVDDNIKTYNFLYSYLGNTSFSSTCRLLLTELIEGYVNNKSNNIFVEKCKHIMSYDQGYLPPKDSRQTDIWGYYNESIAPESWNTKNKNITSEGTGMISRFIVGTNQFFYGRDRSSNESVIQHGMLKSIQYPTGGKTEFQYELNEFSNVFDLGYKSTTIGNIGLKYQVNGNSPNYSFSEVPNYKSTFMDFSIPKETTIMMKLELKSIFPMQCIYPINFANIMILKFNPETLIYEYYDEIGFTLNTSLSPESILSTNVSITLSAGQYKFEMVPFEYLNGTVSFPNAPINSNLFLDTYLSSLDVNTVSKGGGLRIKEISDIFTDNGLNTKTNHKKFNYIKSEISTGYLFVTPQLSRLYLCEYYPDNPFNNGIIQLPIFEYILFKANSYETLNPLFVSGEVGYSYVEELFFSEENEGKIIYEFNIEPPFSNPNIPNFCHISGGLNGMPDKIICYNRFGDKIKKDEFYYKISSGNVATGLSKFKTHQWITPEGGNKAVSCYLYTFYELKSEWIQKTQEKTTTYYNEENDSIITFTKYQYEPVNYLINKTSVVDNHGDTINNIIKYPTSFTEDLYQLMVGKNLVNLPVEISKYKNGSMLEKKYTTYSDEFIEGLYLPKHITYKQKETENDTIIKYHKYDPKGKPIFATIKDLETIGYLWCYKSHYPIAEIKNISYLELETTAKSLFSISSIDELSRLTIPDEEKLMNGSLQKAFPNALVTTYTYKPLVGMTSKTDPRGVTTYYEYDDFGRLKATYIGEKDENGNEVRKLVTGSFDYHYRE